MGATPTSEAVNSLNEAKSSISSVLLIDPLPPESIAGTPLLPAAARSAKRRAAWLNALLLLTLVTVGGLTPVASRFAMVEMPMFSTGVCRFGIAAILLWLTTRLIRNDDERWRRPIAHADCPRILFCAFLCVPVNQAFYLSGVKLANASHSGLLYALNPVLVFLLTLMLGLTKFSWRMGCATLLAFGGAAVVGLDGLRFGNDALFFRGDLCLLMAVASWAGYSVLIGPLGEKYGPVRALTLIMLAGTAMYLPALMIDGRDLFAHSFSTPALLGFAFITLFTAYLNYMLWFIAVLRINVNRLAIAMNAGPVIAIVSAHYICNEPISRWLLAGATLIVCAMTLANWDRLRTVLRGA